FLLNLAIVGLVEGLIAELAEVVISFVAAVSKSFIEVEEALLRRSVSSTAAVAVGSGANFLRVTVDCPNVVDTSAVVAGAVIVLIIVSEEARVSVEVALKVEFIGKSVVILAALVVGGQEIVVSGLPVLFQAVSALKVVAEVPCFTVVTVLSDNVALISADLAAVVTAKVANDATVDVLSVAVCSAAVLEIPAIAGDDNLVDCVAVVSGKLTDGVDAVEA
ncbi:unnamed protein product, partial [Strongylus vulgaris]